MSNEDQKPAPGSEAERQMQDARRVQDFAESKARQSTVVEVLEPAPVKKAVAKAAPTKAVAKKTPVKKSPPAKKAVAKKAGKK